MGGDSDSVTCSGGCKIVFHLRYVGVTPESIKSRGTKKDWLCNNCRTEIQVGTSESSSRSQSVSQEMLKKTLNEFKKDVVTELKNYSKQFEGFKESLQMFSDTVDNFQKLNNENKNGAESLY